MNESATLNMPNQIQMMLNGSIPPPPIAKLILCDISDAAMGMAYASRLKEGESFTTLELKINFLKPVWKAKLRAEGSVVNGGKKVGLVMCDVFDEQERLIARASSTCMTLKGEQAAGR